LKWWTGIPLSMFSSGYRVLVENKEKDTLKVHYHSMHRALQFGPNGAGLAQRVTETTPMTYP
jgi:hypothetical protein